MAEFNIDHDIWESLKSGNEKALGDLYNRYFRALYNYGMKLVRDKQVVKDAIQDLFVELWKYHAGLSRVHSVKYYLYRSLRRKLAKAAHQQFPHTFAEAPEDYHFRFVAPHESLLVTQEASEEQIAELLKALNGLTKRQKEALFLKFYENLSYPEVASIMAITVKATYKVVLSAIDVLRKNVKKVYALVLISSLLPLQ